jgi:hypothetical protein
MSGEWKSREKLAEEMQKTFIGKKEDYRKKILENQLNAVEKSAEIEVLKEEMKRSGSKPELSDYDSLRQALMLQIDIHNAGIESQRGRPLVDRKTFYRLKRMKLDELYRFNEGIAKKEEAVLINSMFRYNFTPRKIPAVRKIVLEEMQNVVGPERFSNIWKPHGDLKPSMTYVICMLNTKELEKLKENVKKKLEEVGD